MHCAFPDPCHFLIILLQGIWTIRLQLWGWSFGDGTTSIEEDPEHIYDQSGTYQVTLVVCISGGCTSNNLSTPLTITGHPYPIAAFSVSSTILDLPYDPLILNNQ